MPSRATKVTFEYEWEGPSSNPNDEPQSQLLHITASVSAYDLGVTSGPPERCYPPEGGEIEDLEIRDHNGQLFDEDTLTWVGQGKAPVALKTVLEDLIHDQAGEQEYDPC